MVNAVKKKFTKGDFSLMETNLIIQRLMALRNLKQEKDVAKLLGLTPNDFSNRKKRSTLITPIVNWALNEAVDIHWLLTGKSLHEIAISKGKTVKTSGGALTSKSSTKIDQLLSMATRILESNSEMAQPLATMIEGSFKAFESTKQIAGIRQQLSGTQQELEATKAEVSTIRAELDTIRQENKSLKSGAESSSHHCCQKDRRQRHEPVEVDRRTGRADRRRAVNE